MNDFETMDKRLLMEQAKAAQDYDQAKQQLAQVGAAAEEKLKALQERLRIVQPLVEELLDKPGTPLDNQHAEASLEYMEILGQIQIVTQAAMLAHGSEGKSPGSLIGD